MSKEPKANQRRIEIIKGSKPPAPKQSTPPPQKPPPEKPSEK